MYRDVENINKTVCEHFNVETSYPFPDNCKRHQAHIRYIFFYLCDKHVSNIISHQMIVDYVLKTHGVKFCRTCICIAKRTIKNLLCVDKEVIKNINEIELKLV